LGRFVYARGALLLAPAIACMLTFAPGRAGAEPLTLPQVVEHALQNNGELKAFGEEKGIREAGKTRAGLLPNPTLELGGGTGALTGSSAENNLSLGVSQEFLLAGKRHKRLALSDSELEMYRWQLADRQRLLRLEAKSAFYQAILAGQRVALADRAVSLNRQLLDVTRERLEAGDIPELEMNLVKVELARSEGAKIETTDALHQANTRLYTLMGLPVGESPALEGTLEAGSALTKTEADLKLLAQQRRPDLKALQAEKGRGEADVDLAFSEGVPNLTAGLALTRDTTSMEIGGVEGKDTAYLIEVRLSMPIPLFDKNRSGVQEARARRSSTESRLVAAGKAIEREVAAAYASLHNADTVLSLYRTSIIPQLEENLNLTQEAYRLGEVGILAVIQEQKNFFQANEGFLAALHSRQNALVKLEAASAIDLTGGMQ